MDSEGKFWFGIWALICGLAAIGGICFTVGYSYNNTIVVTALSKAANPQAYACVLLSTGMNDVRSERCTLLAAASK